MLRLKTRQVIILFSAVVAFAYLIYRAAFTFNLTSGYAIFASLFLYVGEFYGIVTMLLFFFSVWDTTEPPEQPVLENRTVDVFVPTYNEDPDILRTTLEACVRMDYPHKTYLCDDGGTVAKLADPEKGEEARQRAETLKAICEELGAIYCTREENNHAKAGNLNYVFERTDGEFIIIFDADHVADPNFITRLIGYFADEKLAFIQTPHAFYNFESYQGRVNHEKAQYWEEGQLFYHVIQPGRNYWNAPIFAGSAAMFRRTALAEVGYIATETITEDMHTGLRMHAKGWTSLGISERMISGQAAHDITTFYTQRLRWGEGNLSVFAYDNPLTVKGLTWGQRLCYLNTMVNWCGGLFKIPIYLTPILMLLTGIPPVNEFNWTLGIITASYMAACIFGTKYASNGYGSMWYSELFTMSGFWIQVMGTMKAVFLRHLSQFVVTSKRGRQDNSIWRYIRPQVYLIAISVIALVWAWGRIWFGISDDFFKPILATFWALFHMLLAYLVVRKAFWPEDQRYSTRIITHLPIEYEPSEAEPNTLTRCGVSFDLNERGVGLIAYEPLEEGARLRITVHSPKEKVYVDGIVRNVRMLADEKLSATDRLQAYRCGIQFVDVEPKRVDALNRVTLQYAIPRLYQYYEEGGHQPMELSVWSHAASALFRRRGTTRRSIHLPVFLTPDGFDAHIPSVTEDISRTATAVMLKEKLSEGSEVEFEMVAPTTNIRGIARVLRVVQQTYSARPFYRTVIKFEHFEDNGREHMMDLLDNDNNKRIRKVLQPVAEPTKVPMDRPLVKALCVLVPVIALEYGLFRWNYRDDFFLHNTVVAKQPISAEEAERIDRIYRETMEQTYPSTDRLVLLSHALGRMDRNNELAEIIKKLAPRDRDNLQLQLAMAHAYDTHEEFGKAEAVYRNLLKALDEGEFPESKRHELLLGAARTFVHAGNVEKASEYYRQVLKLDPNDMELRNEWAGALLGAHRLKAVEEVYEGVRPNYRGRLLLVLARTSAQDYDAAAREVRAMLAEKPGDPTAEALLADILNQQGNHLQATAIYKRLLENGVTDLRLGIQLAHSSLWNKNYDEALERFQAILDHYFDDPMLLQQHPDILKGYVNAASSATTLGEAQEKIVEKLYDLVLTSNEQDVFYLTRLAWVLHRLGDDEKSATLLERATTFNLTDPGLRRQIASIYVATGHTDKATALLAGHASDSEISQLLIDTHLKNQNFDEAAKLCRSLLDKNPDAVEIRVRLADILSWDKQYQESIALFDKLARDYPDNPLYPRRIAEITLWSGDADAALVLLGNLLKKNFDRPTLWWDFVDAAAASKSLSTAQTQTIFAIYDKTLDGTHIDERVTETFKEAGRELAEVTFLTRLGWVLVHHLEDIERAQVILDRAIVLQPRVPERRKELAGVLAAAARYDDALKMYEGLTLTFDDRLALAKIYAGAHKFVEALEQCQLVLDEQPLLKEAQVLQADIYSWDQQFARSLELFDQLERLYPEDKDIRRRIAEVTLWSKDYAGAVALFQRLLEADREQPALWSSYLEAVGEIDKLTTAQRVLTEWILKRPIADEPAKVALMTNMAWVFHHHFREDGQAQAYLQRAMRLQSTDVVALARLGWMLHRLGDEANSGHVLARAVALCPAKVDIVDRLANVLAATHHFKEALALYRTLIEAKPEDPNLQTKYAQLLVWNHEYTQALEMLEKLLALDPEQQQLWPAYVDAASGANQLTGEQFRLLTHIADGRMPEMPPTEQALYLSRMAWIVYREGDAFRAKGLLDRAVALNPTDSAARQEIAGVLVAVGKAADALPWLEELAQADPKDEALQAKLAEVTLWAGQPAKAVQRLGDLLEAKFDQPTLWISFVDAAASAGEGKMTPAQVRCLIRIALEPTPESVPNEATYLARLAWSLYREGHEERATPLLERAMKLKPLDLAAKKELAGLLAALGRHQEALTWLKQLVQANPNDAQLQGQLAQAMLWSGDAVNALPQLQQLLENDIDQPRLWESYVTAASQAKALTAPQVRLLEAIADKPTPGEDPDSKALFLSRLAWCLYREGTQASKPTLQAQARRLADQAAALDPTDPGAREEIAGVLVAVGNAGAALPWLETLAQANPNDVALQTKLAEVTLWAGQPAKALQRLTLLLTKDFEQPQLWICYLDAAAAIGTSEMAREELQLVEKIRARPIPKEVNNPAIYLSRLAWILYREGDKVEAENLVEQALKLQPKDTESRKQLAGVLTALGRHKQALAWLEELAVVDPADEGLQVQLAQVTLWSGDAALAVQRLHKLLQAKFEQPLLWSSYIDAASELNKGVLTRAQLDMVLRIASQPDPKVLAEPVLYLSRLAWVLFREEYTEEADTILNTAVALEPTEPSDRRALARVLVAAGKTAEGLRMYEGLTLEIDDRFQLIALYAASQKFDEAEQQVRAILRKEPDNRRAQGWLADIALWSNGYPLALTSYQQLLDQDFEQPLLWPGFIEAASFVDTLTPSQRRLVMQISKRVDAEQDPVFLARLALVLDREVEGPERIPLDVAQTMGLLAAPSLAAPLQVASIRCAETARLTPGRQLLFRAIELRPQEPTILARLSWVVYRMGYASKAADILDEAIDQNPVLPAVRRELGDVLVATRRFDEAVTWFENLSATYPANADLKVRLAEVTVWAGQYAKGLARIEKLLRDDLEPQSLWHTFVDGAAATFTLADEEIALALRLANRPVPLKGADDQTRYLSRLAWSLYRESERQGTREYGRAISRLLDEALALESTSMSVWRELGGVLIATGRYADAMQLFQKIVERSPWDAEAQAHLAEIALLARNYEEALRRYAQMYSNGSFAPRHWRSYVDAASSAENIPAYPHTTILRRIVATTLAQPPKDDVFLMRLAWVMRKAGQPSSSVTLLEMAMKQQPDSLQTRRRLAEALQAAGRYKEAEYHYRILLRSIRK